MNAMATNELVAAVKPEIYYTLTEVDLRAVDITFAYLRVP